MARAIALSLKESLHEGNVPAGQPAGQSVSSPSGEDDNDDDDDDEEEEEEEDDDEEEEVQSFHTV